MTKATATPALPPSVSGKKQPSAWGGAGKIAAGTAGDIIAGAGVVVSSLAVGAADLSGNAAVKKYTSKADDAAMDAFKCTDDVSSESRSKAIEATHTHSFTDTESRC